MNDYAYLLSVIIVSWRARNTTLQCLTSIFNSKDFNILRDNIEIIVIDNGSIDGIKNTLSESFTNLFVIENSKNVGYAAACNQGIAVSRGKYVLLLGNDTLIKDNAFLGNISFLEKNPTVGAVTARLLNDDGSLQKGNCKQFPSLRDGVFTYLGLYNLTKKYQMSSFKYDKLVEVDQAATTYLMVRGDLLRDLKGFNERYKILYNDVDLCKRIKNKKYKIVFNPETEIYHKGNYSTRQASPKLRLIMYADIFRYYYDSYSWKALVLIPVLFMRYLAVLLFKYN